ncbi:hypothetical protein JHK87_026270 [Glycine soja]|nr:hypothetical protein JHK87_026270 [Glycine soja]
MKKLEVPWEGFGMLQGQEEGGGTKAHQYESYWGRKHILTLWQKAPRLVKALSRKEMHYGACATSEQGVHAINLSDGRSMQPVIFVLFVRRRCIPQYYYAVNIFSVKTVYQSEFSTVDRIFSLIAVAITNQWSKFCRTVAGEYLRWSLTNSHH